MGTSQAFNAATGRWALDCGQCGRVGEVRKRPCPAGYCPSSQLCGPCYAAARASGQWADWHRDCAAGHAAYTAAEAAKNAEPHRWASAAWGDWHSQVRAGMVAVKTRAGTWMEMPKGDYHPGEPLPASAAPIAPITAGM